MNKIDKEDILLFRDTVNTQAPVDKDGVSRIRKLEWVFSTLILLSER
jgi:hypothetical protein